MVILAQGSLATATGKVGNHSCPQRIRTRRLSTSPLATTRRYYGKQTYDNNYKRICLSVKWRTEEINEFVNYVEYGICEKYGHLEAKLLRSGLQNDSPRIQRLDGDMREEINQAKAAFGYERKMRKLRELERQAEVLLIEKKRAERDFEIKNGFRDVWG